MLPDPVAQGLFTRSQAACSFRLTLARLNKPRRPLLELKRVTSPLRLRHLRYPFALEQPAKGYVLRGQAQSFPLLDAKSPKSMFHRCRDTIRVLFESMAYGLRESL